MSEMGVLPEGLPIILAFVGSLSRVDSLMLGKGATVTEGLPTNSTFVGPLPGVDPLVLREVDVHSG